MDRIAGRLIVTGEDAALHLADGSALHIIDPEFQSRLFAAAPGFVGGAHLYNGPCQLTGITVAQDATLSIASVGSGRYRVDGIWYEF